MDKSKDKFLYHIGEMNLHQDMYHSKQDIFADKLKCLEQVFGNFDLLSQSLFLLSKY